MEWSLFNLGLILIFVGFTLTVLSVLLLSLHGVKEGKMKGGGIVMIGPIPIIFGTDKESLKILIILGIVLVILVFALTLVFR